MMKENEPNSDNYNEANFQADAVLDEYFGAEIERHIDCNCHQCQNVAETISEDWMFGIDPNDIAEWRKDGK